MADVITLTAQPIRQTTPVGTVYQPIWAVRDVLEYDVLELEIGVVNFEGPSPSITFRIVTSLQCDNDEEWVGAGPDTTITTANTFTILGLHGNFFRYLRWSIISWGGQTATTFWIRGMARTYQELAQPDGQG